MTTELIPCRGCARLLDNAWCGAWTIERENWLTGTSEKLHLTIGEARSSEDRCGRAARSRQPAEKSASSETATGEPPCKGCRHLTAEGRCERCVVNSPDYVSGKMCTYMQSAEFARTVGECGVSAKLREPLPGGEP